MKLRSASLLLTAIAGAGSVFLACGAAFFPVSGSDQTPPPNPPAKITIDYPLNGSIFPPEITPPTFLWRDPTDSATRWVVEVSFASHSESIRLETPGAFMQAGESDPQTGKAAELTPEQAATRTWKPDAETWTKIKRLSVKSPATMTITGFAADSKPPVSAGKVTIFTSRDPVGAPIFYRDVPLLISPPAAHGAIQPLPPSSLPLIKWELRSIGETHGHTVMENLPTCANCHSFSADGKTMGLDMDGPRNDKGLYALLPVSKNMTIRKQDILRWSAFQENAEIRSNEPTVKRFGFMSQVSPDGRFVVTSMSPPGTKSSHKDENPGFAAGVVNRLFSMNYKDVRFLQVFYPTRGILGWYDRKNKIMRPLPGADDPEFVHTSAFWSPDGKYLIFSRARASDPYPPGAERASYANDPLEPQIQYDLYKIPFNEGQGGRAVPILGASANGMSNNFPKVSPDGRWIVFVQNKTGLLMRPDSKLYILPLNGGKPRLMNCNTWRMNSWHSFSPNGRWLAFSSKGRSPYTQLMLTHIDAQGNDSPAIVVDNTTAANRAVNIPEFLNLPPGGLEKIDPQATAFYKFFNESFDFMENNQIPEAIQAMRSAIERDPDDPLAHYGLATYLTAINKESDALVEYRKACALSPGTPAWLDHLAVSLALNGEVDEAAATWRKSLALKPSDPGAETDLGTLLFENGHQQEGLEHLQKAVTLAPAFPDGHNHLGMALAQMGRTDAAVDELHQAIAILPTSVEYLFNLGYVLEERGDFAGALAPLQKSVELSESKNWHCLAELARAYDKTGHPDQAIPLMRQALDLAHQEHNDPLAKNLHELLDRYQRDSAQPQPQ